MLAGPRPRTAVGKDAMGAVWVAVGWVTAVGSAAALAVGVRRKAFDSADVHVGAMFGVTAAVIVWRSSRNVLASGFGAVRAAFKLATEHPLICQKSSSNKPARRQPVACGLRGKCRRRLISRCGGDISFLKSIITLSADAALMGKRRLDSL